MKPYQIAMGVALAGAAALVAFGDKTPSSGIAEPVARAGKATGAAPPAPPAAALQAAAERSGKDGKSTPEPAILRLVPRAALVGDSGDASFAAGEG
ncbi:MAG: hypothetical protein ABIQ08_09465, partial [Duganella sp.]